MMVTKGEEVCCNRAIALKDLAPCTQEETDVYFHAGKTCGNGEQESFNDQSVRNVLWKRGILQRGVKDLCQTQSMHFSS